MATTPPLAKKKDTFESALQNANQLSHRAARRWSNYKLLRNPNLGERRSCHVSYSQWTLNGQSLSNLVKVVKSGKRLVKEEGVQD